MIAPATQNLDENPVDQINRAIDFWDIQQFKFAAEIFRVASTKIKRTLFLDAFADLAEATYNRQENHFKDARNKCAAIIGRLPILFDGEDDAGLLEFVISSQQLCENCRIEQNKTPGDTLLREFLDSALRLESQNRYADAAARLYRAMELQTQIWLYKATDGIVLNGKCQSANRIRLPELIRERSDLWQSSPQGHLSFGLEQSISCLKHLKTDDPKIEDCVQRILKDIRTKGQSGRFRQATALRNGSTIGHGNQAVGQQQFKEMKSTASVFFNFDLLHQSNPIPPFNEKWLHPLFPEIPPPDPINLQPSEILEIWELGEFDLYFNDEKNEKAVWMDFENPIPFKKGQQLHIHFKLHEAQHMGVQVLSTEQSEDHPGWLSIVENASSSEVANLQIPYNMNIRRIAFQIGKKAWDFDLHGSSKAEIDVQSVQLITLQKK